MENSKLSDNNKNNKINLINSNNIQSFPNSFIKYNKNLYNIQDDKCYYKHNSNKI